MFNIFICSALMSVFVFSNYEKDFPIIAKIIYKNIYDGKKDGKSKNSNYFNQNVFKHVDKILTDLKIQSESPRLPQDGGIVQMDGFDYIEFEIDLVDCSFEKFGQFVNRLEKNDKIFVIDRFEFENSVGRGVQKALQNDGIFPGKNISMKIWAINLNKSSPSNIKKKGSI